MGGPSSRADPMTSGGTVTTSDADRRRDRIRGLGTRELEPSRDDDDDELQSSYPSTLRTIGAPVPSIEADRVGSSPERSMHARLTRLRAPLSSLFYCDATRPSCRGVEADWP